MGITKAQVEARDKAAAIGERIYKTLFMAAIFREVQRQGSLTPEDVTEIAEQARATAKSAAMDEFDRAQWESPAVAVFEKTARSLRNPPMSEKDTRAGQPQP